MILGTRSGFAAAGTATVLGIAAVAVFGWNALVGVSADADTMARHLVAVQKVERLEVEIHQLAAGSLSPEPPGDELHLGRLEKITILRALRECGGRKKEAAERLGIALRTLYNKLHEYRGESLPAEAEGAGATTSVTPPSGAAAAEGSAAGGSP